MHGGQAAGQTQVQVYKTVDYREQSTEHQISADEWPAGGGGGGGGGKSTARHAVYYASISSGYGRLQK